ncbi:MAG TPA: glycogen synthase GlgA [Burkholderiales bacterium]|nr:glycogen synthase GlgA [Burkholderiales bacterium]
MNRTAARILFVTPELAPWAKAGGLGEVSRDLPRALAAAGLDVRILVPAFPALTAALPDLRCVAEFPAPGGALAPARLLQASHSPPIYLVECAHYYERAGLYQSPAGNDWPDNHLRFSLLARIAAILGGAGSPLDWQPHVVHCHDWQTGLTPAYLAHRDGGRAASVMTVHNLAYQGVFPPHVLDEMGMPREAFTVDGLEYYGNVSLLKAGLSYATRITTVSPTYAREILQPELGFGLDALLRRRAGDLSGISNGIDLEQWDPSRDPHLERTYDAGHFDGKLQNKLALQRELGLPIARDVPLLGIVSRLVWQKGIDLLVSAAPAIVAMGAQIVVHGDGDRDLEQALRDLAMRHPRDIAVRIGFDERLNHRLVAGADAFLLPSRYEPCGLTQLHSMRYGTLPVAHATGGLTDWVVDVHAETLRNGTATGFSFAPLTVPNLVATVERALDTYRAPVLWRTLQRHAMSRECGWTASAASYCEVYRAAAGDRWPRLTGADRPVARSTPRVRRAAAGSATVQRAPVQDSSGL